MQNPNNPSRRYSVIEGNAIEATGTIIQFIPTTGWPFLQAVLLLDSPQDRNGVIVSYPVNRIKALPTQEEANETLGSNKQNTNKDTTLLEKLIAYEIKLNNLIKVWNHTVTELTQVKARNEDLESTHVGAKNANQELWEANKQLRYEIAAQKEVIKDKESKISALEHAAKDLTSNNQDLFNQREALKEVVAKQKQELEELRINHTRKIENIKRQFRDIAFNS